MTYYWAEFPKYRCRWDAAILLKGVSEDRLGPKQLQTLINERSEKMVIRGEEKHDPNWVSAQKDEEEIELGDREES